MENLLFYFLKANTVLAFGFVLYKFLVGNQRWFQLNRVILITIGMIALFSPFLPNFSALQNNTLLTIYLPEFNLNQGVERSSLIVDWFRVSITGYFLISALFLTRFLSQIIGLLRFKKGKVIGKYLIINTNRIETSSFFNRIFINDSLNGSTREIALTHEKVHVDHWHTIDVIWFEMLTVIFWLNPAAWLLKKELRNTHEYIADLKTREHFGQKDYFNAILNNTFNSQSINFIPKFSNSQTLKNRIIMMKSNQPVKKMRYALFLPIIAVVTITSANTSALKATPKVFQIEQTQPQDTTYTVVEQMPEFPGGQSALFEYLKNNITYPKSAKKDELEGKVILSFVVNKEGDVQEVKVIKGVRNDIDKEAIRVVQAMPKWKPGYQRGKNVNVSFNLPISFKLDSKK